MNEFLEVIWDCLKSNYASTRKWLFLSVHRAFVIESTLSIAALVPGMCNKEDSCMSCVFFNEIHSLYTDFNISDHFSKAVSDCVFYLSIHPFVHSSYIYICSVINSSKFHLHLNSLLYFCQHLCALYYVGFSPMWRILK
jgi:hypothetical protein